MSAEYEGVVAAVPARYSPIDGYLPGL